MSKSLNQAFIKAYSKEAYSKEAYSKEKAHDVQGQVSPASAVVNQDDYIVRFDTATCILPEPHLKAAEKPQASSTAIQSSTLKLPPPHWNRTVPSAKAVAVEESSRSESSQREAEELRSAIASQMSRSVAWEDQQIDAFIGGFPMISPFHQRHAGQRLGSHESRAEMVASGRETGHVAGAASGPVRVTPLETLTPQSAHPQPAPVSAPAASTIPAPIPAPQNVGGDKLAHAPFEASGSFEESGSEAPQLSPPASPALLSPQNQPSIRSEARTREEQVRQSAPPGEIFRLDRPSYAQSLKGDEEAAFSDSGEQSSELLELSASGTNLDLSPLNLVSDGSVDAEHASRASQVKSVERDLRRAKVRIFNPVWEVDNFQWPPICLELLEQRAESMEVVAQNLIGACQEGLQVLAVTSPQSGQGRTTVACCLAKLAGSRGLNVAIVDGDIENPTLSYQTNLDVDQDWKTAIFSQLSLEEVAVHSIDDQVTLIPLMHPITQSEMATDDNRIDFMLHELSESFDLVIVDIGHMGSSRSLLTSLSERGVISAVVAVVDNRNSNQQQIDHCLRRIRQAGVVSIGLVENFAA